MLKVAVAGIMGRMGATIARLVQEADDLELAGATEVEGVDAIGKTPSELFGFKDAYFSIESDVSKAVENADVYIDFTSPEASVASARVCSDAGVACVIGTTGLTKKQISNLGRASGKVAIVFAPNMSMGINLLKKLVERAAASLGDEYDIEIVEAHHKMKADAPSGTALMLARAAAQARGLDYDSAAVYGREGKTGVRPKDQIGVMTLRGGDIVGDHTVMFAGPGERIELVHRAHTRETFARGALRAARWVVDAEPALYGMADVLGLK